MILAVVHTQEKDVAVSGLDQTRLGVASPSVGARLFIRFVRRPREPRSLQWYARREARIGQKNKITRRWAKRVTPPKRTA
jgi:hypothetical protein